MGNFIFNGISAADMGLRVERIPDIPNPEKEMEYYDIPGLPGGLSSWKKTWKPVMVRYECWFKGGDVGKQARDIRQWLHNAPTNARLEDTYDDQVYRLATYVGGGTIENIRERYGRMEIAFRCDPRSYLKSGDSALNGTSSILLNNTTGNDAFPIIEVTGSTGGLLAIGDTSLLIRFPGYEKHTIRLDTLIREAWDITDGGETSMNAWVTGTDWPKIVPGSNKITIDGGLESVRVYPRWWKI